MTVKHLLLLIQQERFDRKGIEVYIEIAGIRKKLAEVRQEDDIVVLVAEDAVDKDVIREMAS